MLKVIIVILCVFLICFTSNAEYSKREMKKMAKDFAYISLTEKIPPLNKIYYQNLRIVLSGKEFNQMFPGKYIYYENEYQGMLFDGQFHFYDLLRIASTQLIFRESKLYEITIPEDAEVTLKGDCLLTTKISTKKYLLETNTPNSLIKTLSELKMKDLNKKKLLSTVDYFKLELKMDLTNYDFSNAYLQNVLFKSDLTGAIFNHSIMNRVLFESCYLRNAQFKYIRQEDSKPLHEAYDDWFRFGGVKFKKCQLINGFTDDRFEGTNFKHSVFKNY